MHAAGVLGLQSPDQMNSRAFEGKTHALLSLHIYVQASSLRIRICCGSRRERV